MGGGSSQRRIVRAAHAVGPWLPPRFKGIERKPAGPAASPVRARLQSATCSIVSRPGMLSTARAEGDQREDIYRQPVTGRDELGVRSPKLGGPLRHASESYSKCPRDSRNPRVRFSRRRWFALVPSRNHAGIPGIRVPGTGQIPARSRSLLWSARLETSARCAGAACPPLSSTADVRLTSSAGGLSLWPQWASLRSWSQR